MNFSAISRDSYLGKLLRLPLKLLPADMAMPVLQGPMRGMRWIVGSGDHGYWLGSYELDFQRMLAGKIQAGEIVYDIGAHVGYYTLLASRAVGPEGHVYSFEPLPRNAHFIERHLHINRLGNVMFKQVAVADQTGRVNFGGGVSSSTGRIIPQGKFEVQAVKLDDLLSSGEIQPPRVMKIDVEGAEGAVLQGSVSLLEKHGPQIFLATHGAQAREDCAEFLDKLGYSLEPINATNAIEASEFYARVV
jgi:FkbM family methyltransferase